jgi:hypothetical protein
VAAGLAALCDDDVGAGGQGLLGLPAVHHLLDAEDAGVVGAGDQVGGHAEMERDGRRPDLSVAANASSSNGREVWLIAKGRPVSSRSLAPWAARPAAATGRSPSSCS